VGAGVVNRLSGSPRRRSGGSSHGSPGFTSKGGADQEGQPRSGRTCDAGSGEQVPAFPRVQRGVLIATHDAERGRALAGSDCCAERGAFIGAVLTAPERGGAGQCSAGPVGAYGGAPVAGAIEEVAAAVGCDAAIGWRTFAGSADRRAGPEPRARRLNAQPIVSARAATASAPPTRLAVRLARPGRRLALSGERQRQDREQGDEVTSQMLHGRTSCPAAGRTAPSSGSAGLSARIPQSVRRQAKTLFGSGEVRRTSRVGAPGWRVRVG